VLERRRLYLIEQADGTLLITANRERDSLIDESNPVGDHEYYSRAVSRIAHDEDLRDVVGVVGIIGSGEPGTRVYLLDDELMRRGAYSELQDNPWAFSEQDAMLEARRVLDDYRRAMERRVVAGFWDPIMAIGNCFTIREADESLWVGCVTSFRHSLEMGERQLQHRAEWQAEQVLTTTYPTGLWEAGSADDLPEPGDYNWDECYWG
jgi:hypothetical protein